MYTLILNKNNSKGELSTQERDKKVIELEYFNNLYDYKTQEAISTFTKTNPYGMVARVLKDNKEIDTIIVLKGESVYKYFIFDLAGNKFDEDEEHEIDFANVKITKVVVKDDTNSIGLETEAKDGEFFGKKWLWFRLEHFNEKVGIYPDKDNCKVLLNKTISLIADRKLAYYDKNNEMKSYKDYRFVYYGSIKKAFEAKK